MPVDESSDEMEVSPKDSHDSGDSSQGNPAETLGNQSLPSQRRDAHENQESSSGMSTGMSSRTSVPSSVSKTNEGSGSPLGKRRSSGCASPLPSSSVRETVKSSEPRKITEESLTPTSGRRETNTSSSKRSFETGVESTSAKKIKTGQSGDDSSESGPQPAPLGSKLSSPAAEESPPSESPIGDQTRGMRIAAQEGGTSERFTGPLSSRKRERMNSGSREKKDSRKQRKMPSSGYETSVEEHAGGRPSVEEHVDEKPSDEELSNTPDERVSKYVFNARTLLLVVLQEVMEFSNERGLYLEFFRCFQSISKFPGEEDETTLVNRLDFYLLQRQSFLGSKYSCMSLETTMEYIVIKKYEQLVILILQILISTVSVRYSRHFVYILGSYRSLQVFYNTYSNLWQKIDLNYEDGVVNRNMENYKKLTEKLMLQTSNAFRELLMHIGETADQATVSEFARETPEEDLRYLRRQIDTEESSSETVPEFFIAEHVSERPSDTPDRRVSKYVFKARTLLLVVLQEVMNFNYERGMYLEFLRCFQSISEFPQEGDESTLINRLDIYVQQRKSSFESKYRCMSLDETMEYRIMEKYEDLVKLVVNVLASTVSETHSRNFGLILDRFRSLEGFYSGLWELIDLNNEKDMVRRNLEAYKTLTEKLVLQTSNAFREFLMYIGENADPAIIADFEIGTSEENIRYLRMQIDPEDSSSEAVEEEGSSEAVEEEGSSEAVEEGSSEAAEEEGSSEAAKKGSSEAAEEGSSEAAEEGF